MKRKKQTRKLAANEMAVPTVTVEQLVGALTTTLTAIETFGGYLLQHFDTMLAVAPNDEQLLDNRANVVNTLAGFRKMRSCDEGSRIRDRVRAGERQRMLGAAIPRHWCVYHLREQQGAHRR